MTQKRESQLTAEVSHDLCVGVAMCIKMAPRAFRFNRERLSVFKGAGDWTDQQLRDAADACPMSAIRIIEYKAGEESAR